MKIKLLLNEKFDFLDSFQKFIHQINEDPMIESNWMSSGGVELKNDNEVLNCK